MINPPKGSVLANVTILNCPQGFWCNYVGLLKTNSTTQLIFANPQGASLRQVLLPTECCSSPDVFLRRIVPDSRFSCIFLSSCSVCTKWLSPKLQFRMCISSPPYNIIEAPYTAPKTQIGSCLKSVVPKWRHWFKNFWKMVALDGECSVVYFSRILQEKPILTARSFQSPLQKQLIGFRVVFMEPR